MSTQEPCFPDYYDYSERRVCQETKNEIGPDGFCGPHRPPSDMSAEKDMKGPHIATQAELLAQLADVTRERDRLRAALAVAREHISAVHNFHRHALSQAIETASETFFKEAGAHKALRAIEVALSDTEQSR